MQQRPDTQIDISIACGYQRVVWHHLQKGVCIYENVIIHAVSTSSSYLVGSVEDGDGILGNDDLGDLLPLLTVISHIYSSDYAQTDSETVCGFSGKS
jgi:hypothetical protein